MSIGKLVSATVADGQIIALAWDDGLRATLDLAPLIEQRRALADLGDKDQFATARLAEDGWSVEWGCGIDFGAQQLRRWAQEQAGEIMPIAAFRRWTERHGFTLTAAAEALGLSRRTIAYYLSGEQAIPKTVMLATEGYDQRRKAA